MELSAACTPTKRRPYPALGLRSVKLGVSMAHHQQMQAFDAVFVWRQTKADYSAGPVVTMANKSARHLWKLSRPQVDTMLKVIAFPTTQTPPSSHSRSRYSQECRKSLLAIPRQASASDQAYLHPPRAPGPTPAPALPLPPPPPDLNLPKPFDILCPNPLLKPPLKRSKRSSIARPQLPISSSSALMRPRTPRTPPIMRSPMPADGKRVLVR